MDGYRCRGLYTLQLTTNQEPCFELRSEWFSPATLRQRFTGMTYPSHYPKTSGMEMDLQTVEAVWTTPLDVPAVLSMAS